MKPKISWVMLSLAILVASQNSSGNNVRPSRAKGENIKAGKKATIGNVDLKHYSEYVRPEDCKDNSENCRKEAGSCLLNFGYMFDKCKLTCRFCSPYKKEEKNCKDLKPKRQCRLWKKAGDCLHYATFMKDACKKTCRFCGPENRYTDTDEHCPIWGERGTCCLDFHKMIYLCPYSCRKYRHCKIAFYTTQRPTYHYPLHTTYRPPVVHTTHPTHPTHPTPTPTPAPTEQEKEDLEEAEKEKKEEEKQRKEEKEEQEREKNGEKMRPPVPTIQPQVTATHAPPPGANTAPTSPPVTQQVPLPVGTPTPGTQPASVPGQEPTPIQSPVTQPAPVPAPATVPTPAPASAPVPPVPPVPAPATVPAPAPVSAPVPAPAPVTTPPPVVRLAPLPQQDEYPELTYEEDVDNDSSEKESKEENDDKKPSVVTKKRKTDSKLLIVIGESKRHLKKAKKN